MNVPQTFSDFLAQQSPTLALGPFCIDLLLTGLLCLILGFVYVRYGRSLSNRQTLARNFIMVGMTTMIIITIVKSSLALSLGLVGALSIVRFRTAIKEPEELAYLFLTIAVGLGFGANQRVITIVGFAILMVVILISSGIAESSVQANLHLTVTCDSGDTTLEQIAHTLREHCSAVELKRLDEADGTLEASFLVKFDEFAKLVAGKDALRASDESIKVTFIDTNGLI